MDAVLYALQHGSLRIFKEVHRSHRLKLCDVKKLVQVGLEACGIEVSNCRKLRRQVDEFIMVADPGSSMAFGELCMVDDTSIHISFLPRVISSFCRVDMQDSHLEELLRSTEPAARRHWRPSTQAPCSAIVPAGTNLLAS